MLPDPIASVLRSGREQYNARFALARRRWPELDANHFGDFLTNVAAPLVTLTEQARPCTAVAVTEAAYDVALELVGQRLAGRDARHAAINDLWSTTLPPLVSLVAQAPVRLLPALTNAAHALSATPGASVNQWLTLLRDLGPRATTPDELLRLGQVLAWRAGLAHYRQSALAVADALPEALALAAVGAPADASWIDVHKRLADDPWYDPATTLTSGGARSVVPANAPTAPTERRSPREDVPRPRIARLAGAFRGFGGLFMEPPRVAAANGQLLVRSGDEAWLLEADVFGATFHRATPAEEAAFPAPANANATLPPSVARDERVAALGEITSTARGGPTLAFTGALTHQVVLVAL